MNVKELAKKCNRSETAIYDLARKLGRLPTEQEILAVKRGRPQKYK